MLVYLQVMTNFAIAFAIDSRFMAAFLNFT